MITMAFDSPEQNDNRRYDYSAHAVEDRYEYGPIAAFIEHGSSVVDLGCGNGSLMARIAAERSAVVRGVELSASGVEACTRKGLSVIHGSIDQPMPFRDDEFDYAVCNVTMQMVMYPEVLLREMKRIAKRQIVSFPNFANWRNRMELLFHGRMPQSMLYGYPWYSTGHIHQFSVNDFYELAASVGGLRIVGHHYETTRNPVENVLLTRFPNLFQKIPIYLLEKTNDQRP
jgi:methionine biosynthesis protein MetW